MALNLRSVSSRTTSWWWRSGPRQFRVKEKQYEPVPLGFRLAPYDMPVSAKPYKILGNKVSIEIVFELPSVRTEILRGDRHLACATQELLIVGLYRDLWMF